MKNILKHVYNIGITAALLFGGTVLIVEAWNLNHD